MIKDSLNNDLGMREGQDFEIIKSVNLMQEELIHALYRRRNYGQVILFQDESGLFESTEYVNQLCEAYFKKLDYINGTFKFSGAMVLLTHLSKNEVTARYPEFSSKAYFLEANPSKLQIRDFLLEKMRDYLKTRKELSTIDSSAQENILKDFFDNIVQIDENTSLNTVKGKLLKYLQIKFLNLKNINDSTIRNII
ncbi:hypothetical protein [Leptospira bandrabouensis]|uniref:hypothetical protein n=1 Tax=Leptospira bandrabouensis TaxID=2484903 RepID=UPI001EE7D0B0|nr:hypothetical protein [Leptospira bandrabouensis]MCG6146486.1 hypothetical protein [Leptospira bandrabouensis]MCG6161858.1 hypothetical protein [Leptospira bandrabouensis]MCG6166091.1 hypothetical protein [Leptospira bandrabouensis]